jgi:hypothetical protein
MTYQWMYDGTKDQSKFSLDAVIRKLEREHEVKVTDIQRCGGEIVSAIIICKPKITEIR